MKRKIVGLLLGTTAAWPLGAIAQETAWLQIEARQSLSSASAAARVYASELDNVAGFALGDSFYAIALGPYAPEDANRLMQQLKIRGDIPPDSYVVSGDQYSRQFYPVGVGAQVDPQPLPDGGDADSGTLTIEDLTAALDEAESGNAESGNDGQIAVSPLDPVDGTDAEPAAETTPPAEEEEEATPIVVPEPEPEAIPEETQTQALQSESALSRGEKERLQVALRWAGHYNAAIDGLFGRGTRSAMAAWQQAKGHDVTGVLTTRQRAELISDYNAVLEGMDLALVRDDTTGIEMQIPTGVVEFSEYDPPFAKFDPASDDLPVRVLLISQPGNEDRFLGLYEILQTLEIVPEEGERSRNGREFRIDGVGEDVHTHVWATRENDRIKGFMLVWPTGDEERRSRVLAEMERSFARIDGVLDPAIAPPDEDQGVNLVSGLQVRTPELSRSGFYIDSQGTVLTTSEVAQSCGELTIEGSYPASVVHSDPELGIAVLRPDSALAPLAVAEFQTAIPRLQSEVAVAGYPYGGVLSAPVTTFGTLADIRGLNGEEEVQRLALAAQPGDAGGPLFDNAGDVLGMLLPQENGDGAVLPSDVSFAADAEAIVASLSAAGIPYSTAGSGDYIPPERLTLQAADVTVLVSCW